MLFLKSLGFTQEEQSSERIYAITSRNEFHGRRSFDGNVHW